MSNRLPGSVKEQVLSFPEYKMGTHKVAVDLKDGTVIEDVFVAWGDEVVRVGDVDGCTFDGAAVIAAHDRS